MYKFVVLISFILCIGLTLGEDCHCLGQCHEETNVCSEECDKNFKKDRNNICNTCNDGKWGSNCEENCKCLKDISCSRDGQCENGCSTGYTLSNCTYQLPNFTSVQFTCQKMRYDVEMYLNLTLPSDFVYYIIQNSTDNENWSDIVEQTNKTNVSVSLTNLTRGIEHYFRIVPYDLHVNEKGQPTKSMSITTCKQSERGPNCSYPCYCEQGDACDVVTGKCPSTCMREYMTPTCDKLRPSLKNANVTITKHNSTFTLDVTVLKSNIYNVSSYRITYRTYMTNIIFISTDKEKSSTKKEDDGSVRKVSIDFTPDIYHINSIYEMQLTPLLNNTEEGLKSGNVSVETTCGQYQQMYNDECKNWCMCSNDSRHICLKTSEFCSDSEQTLKLPSEADTFVSISDNTDTTMTLVIDTFYDTVSNLSYRITLHNKTIKSDVLGEKKILIPNLTAGTFYTFKVQIMLSHGNHSAISQHFICSGQTKSNNKSIGIIIGILVTLLLIIAIGICTFRRHRILYHLRCMKDKFQSLNTSKEPPTYTSRQIYDVKNPIKCDQLENYLKKQTIGKFKSEFSSLPQVISTSLIEGYSADASFVDAYKKDNAFINARIPYDHQYECWWKLIWDKNINTVVSLTTPKDEMNYKGDMYWPKTKEKKLFGGITVHFISKKTYAFYTKVSLFLKKETRHRNVTLLIFTGWSNEPGLPIIPEFLEFHHKVNGMKSEGPHLVYCGSGSGMSSAFISVDYLMKQAKDENLIDVKHCVSSHRLKRHNTIHTVQQYM